MASAAPSLNSTTLTSPSAPPASRYNYKKRQQMINHHARSRSRRRKDVRCQAGSGGGRRGSAVANCWAGEYDLYSLLGVQRTSDAAEIRKAYRALQKRCHPDIAGPAGHDMAILLNQVYSFLSDPVSRDAYDRVLCSIPA